MCHIRPAPGKFGRTRPDFGRSRLGSAQELGKLQRRRPQSWSDFDHSGLGPPGPPTAPRPTDTGPMGAPGRDAHDTREELEGSDERLSSQLQALRARLEAPLIRGRASLCGGGGLRCRRCRHCQGSIMGFGRLGPDWQAELRPSRAEFGAPSWSVRGQLRLTSAQLSGRNSLKPVEPGPNLAAASAHFFPDVCFIFFESGTT